MNRAWLACLLEVVLPLAGCSWGYDVAPPPAARKATPPQPAPHAPATPPQSSAGFQAGAGRPAQTPPGTPVPAPAPGAVATSRAAVPAGQSLGIRLSAGVALPQTLPDGTAMGFSVDYQFTQGQPDPNAQYVWVIERGQGPAARLPVRLEQQGTLQKFIPDFRPEQRPFETHLEDPHGNRLSASAKLR